MIYKDGYPVNNSGRVMICPKCKNEEFSKGAEFCRICGTRIYNKCEGEWDEHDQVLVQHDNPGNARYCETCGKPTYFYKQNFLTNWRDYIKEDGDDTPLYFDLIEEIAVMKDANPTF